MQKAFTLIELVIVIAIISLMAVLAIPAFDSYGAKADLDNKADEIKIAIEEAHQAGISPKPGNDIAEVIFNNGSAAALPKMVVNYGKCLTSCTTGNYTLSVNESKSVEFNPSSGNPYFSSSSLTGNIKMAFFSPTGENDILKKIGTTPNLDSAQIVLDRKGSSVRKLITVFRNPFKVTIEDQDVSVSP